MWGWIGYALASDYPKVIERLVAMEARGFAPAPLAHAEWGLAERHLTDRLFGQILWRVGRLRDT
jgi:hypothetical protein